MPAVFILTQAQVMHLTDIMFFSSSFVAFPLFYTISQGLPLPQPFNCNSLFGKGLKCQNLVLKGEFLRGILELLFKYRAALENDSHLWPVKVVLKSSCLFLFGGK